MAFFKKKNSNKNLRPSISISISPSMQNAASTLLANIRFSSVDKPIKSIVVTSAAPNEGKSTVAVALAIAMAKAEKKVLLVEGDMRRRSLQSMLGVRTPYGIHSVLTKEHSAEEAIVATDYEGLYFLNAEAGIPNPEALLASQVYAGLIDQLCETFDYVVVDTPPVAAFSDAPVLASKLDGVALVVREGQTERAEAAYAAEQLRASNANILGVVMNGKTATSAGYGYGYDYYYEEKSVPAGSAEADAAK